MARFFTAFVSALSCSPLAAAHPKLAAAKGEQVEKHITLFPSLRLCREISVSIARKPHSAAGIGHGFYGPSANAGCAVQRLDRRNIGVLCFLACAADAAGSRDGRNKSPSCFAVREGDQDG